MLGEGALCYVYKGSHKDISTRMYVCVCVHIRVSGWGICKFSFFDGNISCF